MKEIRRAKEVLRGEMPNAEALAERHIMRTQTDFLGRLCEAYAKVDAVFDEAPEGNLTPDQAREAYEGYSEMAGLALAQMTFIQMQHPGVKSRMITGLIRPTSRQTSSPPPSRMNRR